MSIHQKSIESSAGFTPGQGTSDVFPTANYSGAETNDLSRVTKFGNKGVSSDPPNSLKIKTSTTQHQEDYESDSRPEKGDKPVVLLIEKCLHYQHQNHTVLAKNDAARVDSPENYAEHIESSVVYPLESVQLKFFDLNIFQTKKRMPHLGLQSQKIMVDLPFTIIWRKSTIICL